MFTTIIALTLLSLSAPPPAWGLGIPKETPEPERTYNSYYAEAVAQKIPLVVGVGCPPVVPTGYLSCRADQFAAGQGPFILVGVPIGEELVRIQKDFPPSCSVKDIRNAVNAVDGMTKSQILGIEVRQRPVPFPPGLLAAETADEIFEAPGRWPEDLMRPVGMRRYLPAKFTQEIAVTNERDRITPVPRTGLLRKWQVPGGMEHATGWQSELYKFVSEAPRSFVGNIPVLNSFGYFQNNRGWRRNYAEGTYFCDVLSNSETGKVFEIRYRTKENGEWQNDVAYRNAQERPPGFVRMKSKQCAACHSEAGTGSYSAGLVPGGDGVLSDPLPLEN